MATVTFCNDASDVSSISSPASGDTAWIADQTSREFSVQRYNGSAWDTLAVADVNPAEFKLAYYSYQTSAGTGGGDVAAATWTTYPLTNEDYDGITITLDTTNDYVTVPAGKYRIEGGVGFHEVVDAAVVRVYDESAGEYFDVDGLSLATGGALDMHSLCLFSGMIEFSSATNVQLKFYAKSARTGDGLGDAYALSSLAEVFGFFSLMQVEAY